jgi:hypothetical protein
LIFDNFFKQRHRVNSQAFTRDRALPFALVFVSVLRKSLKSLQNVVNELMTDCNRDPVSGSAYSQARYKLKHTAFIELNQKAIVETVYADGHYLRFRSMRVLGVDGSKILLPDSQDVREEFGTLSYSQGADSEVKGEHPYALASVLYDVLNRIVLTAELGKADAYEVDLAVQHLEHARPGDLLVMDRNYPSYRMLAELTRRNLDFVIRCSSSSFSTARKMFKGKGANSRIVRLKPSAGRLSQIRKLGLPQTLTVRFVRVQLNTGEWEVLVTSLKNEQSFLSKDFQELYYLRWGVETFYGLLKTRLGLENFTGIKAEAVRQDFFSTLYLSGLESVLTADAQAKLDERETRWPQKINRAVSFNALKKQAISLLLSDAQEDTDQLFERLTQLFLQSPCPVRPDRSPPRKKPSDRHSLTFHKRRKKICY